MFPRGTPAGLATMFGALEVRVLEALWRRGLPATVRDLQSDFPRAAYTTLMTTLDRLHRKGVLAREKAGRAFAYSPRQTREALESGVAARALGSVLAGPAAQPVLSFFVEEISRQDGKLLDELERLVREKRKQYQEPR